MRPELRSLSLKQDHIQFNAQYGGTIYIISTAAQVLQA